MDLSREEFLRAPLRRHRLVRRARLRDAIGVVGDIGGLQAQNETSAEMQALSRVEGVTRGWLPAQLAETRRLAKAWLMRGTLHAVPREDLGIYAAALREEMLERLERWKRRTGRPDTSGIRGPVLAALGEGPATRAELRSRMRRPRAPTGWELSAWGGVLRELCLVGKVVHVGRQGNESRFARTSVWLGLDSDSFPDPADAGADLLVRYLRAYGPATPAQFGWWTGLRMPRVRTFLERAETRLEPVRVEGESKVFYVPRRESAAIRRSLRAVPRPAVLLGKFDPLLLGIADRSRLMDPTFRSRVFRAVADIAPTVLVDGRLAGTWRYRVRSRSLQVVVEPFHRVSRATAGAIREEADRIRAFFGVDRLEFSV